MVAIAQQFEAARNAGVPLVKIDTPDQEATVATLTAAASDETPVFEWDSVRGLRGRNQQATELLQGHALQAMAATLGVTPEDAAQMVAAGEAELPETMLESVVQFLTALPDERVFPENSLVFMHNSQWWLENGAVQHDEKKGLARQAVANLRDQYKQNFRTLVMLSPGFTLPPELASDVIAMDEQLPDADKLGHIVDEVHESVELELPSITRERAVNAVRGLAAYEAEQVLSMCLRRSGLDMDGVWDRKRQQIEQTDGLSVYLGGETFADIGGNEQVKRYLERVMKGRGKPRVVVWLDEIEKTGLGHTGDSSGVNADQLGTLLSYLEDHDAYGSMLVGPPGTGKSAVAKGCGSTHDVVTIRIDLGAAQDRWVGASQDNLRRALKVITAVGGDSTLWLATSNSIEGLDSALKSRFTDVFFFDLPNREEKDVIWNLWRAKKQQLSDEPNPADEGWAGRNIRQCCDKAWRMECTLAEAAEFIVPVEFTAGEDIERLRTHANRRYLSASTPGLYRCEGASLG